MVLRSRLTLWALRGATPLALLGVFACGGDGTTSTVNIPPDGGARPDATSDAGPELDGGREDAGPLPLDASRDAQDRDAPVDGGQDAPRDGGMDSAMDGPRDSGNMGRTEAIAAYAAALCALHARCAPYALEVQFGTEETCIARTSVLGYQLLPEGVGARATPQDLGLCTQALTAMTCADRTAGKHITGCSLPLGTQPVGGGCQTHLQCASGSCSGASSSQCGSCVSKQKEKSPCSPGYTVCEDGLVCGVWNASDLGESPTCRKVRRLGESCDPDNLCEGSLYCSLGTCKEPKTTAGASCDVTATKNACSGLIGLRCDKTTGTCVEQAQTALTGEECGSSIAGTVLCRGDLYCDGTDKRCFARTSDGSSCDSASFSNTCLPYSRCSSGRCAPDTPKTCP